MWVRFMDHDAAPQHLDTLRGCLAPGARRADEVFRFRLSSFLNIIADEATTHRGQERRAGLLIARTHDDIVTRRMLERTGI
jgi:hypothetical protein